MRALLHIHTSFSYDGDVSPEDVADGARSLGARVVFLSEHLQGLTSASYADLLRRAEELSDETLTIVPGLEVSLPGGGDLLALGAPALPESRNICCLADEVREWGGVSVLAHPGEAGDLSPAALRKLDGVEVWNGLHDSKYFPNGASLAFLRRVRSHNGDLFGCCGLDLHRRDGWFPLALELDAGAGGPLEALRAGAFTYGRRNMTFAAAWIPRPPTLAALACLTAAYKALAVGLKATGCSLPLSLSGFLKKTTGEEKRIQ